MWESFLVPLRIIEIIQSIFTAVYDVSTKYSTSAYNLLHRFRLYQFKQGVRSMKLWNKATG